MTTTFEDLRKAAKLLLSQPMSFSVDDFVRKVEEYVQGLPEWRRNSYLGYFGPIGARLVKYSDLPRLLREDPEFRERYIRALASL